jgi:TRAP transporter TAXI family solute receptor
MSKAKKYLFLLVSMLLVLVLALGACTSPEAPAQPTTPTEPAKPTGPYVLRIGTSKSTSRGFATALAIQKVVATHSDTIEVRGLTTPGSQASQVMVSFKEVEGNWNSAFDLYQLTQGMGRWRQAPIPAERWSQMGAFFTQSLRYWVVKKDLADKIKSMSDMKGYKLGIGDVGTAYHDPDKLVMEKLGITEDNSKYVPLEPARTSDAFAQGQIDAAGVYAGVGGETLPSFAIELDSRVPVCYVRYTEEEQKAVDTVPAFATATAPRTADGGWTQDLCMDPGENIRGNISSYGYHFHEDVPEEAVYEFLKICYDYWDEIQAISALCQHYGPAPQAKENNVSLISSFVGSELKLHRGAAKFYKEIGWWQDSWSSLVP